MAELRSLGITLLGSAGIQVGLLAKVREALGTVRSACRPPPESSGSRGNPARRTARPNYGTLPRGGIHAAPHVFSLLSRTVVGDLRSGTPHYAQICI